MGLRVLEALYAGRSGDDSQRGMGGGRRLRVLRLVSSLTQGGVGKVCLQTVWALDSAAIETKVLVFGEKSKRVTKRSWPSAVHVLAEPLRLAPTDDGFRFFRDVVRLGRLIEESDPDIVHLHEPQYVLAVEAAVGRASRKGKTVRLVVHLHNDYRERTRSMPDSLLPLIKRALRRSELIACSETIESAAADWLGIPVGQVARIEDGADDRVFEPKHEETVEALREAAGENLVVACMANLVPHKRIQDFIAAGARLSDEGLPVFFLLMGYGKKEAAQSVREFFDSRIDPMHGEFLYRVGQPHTLLSRVDIGVSCSALEGLGLNILEYQSSGIPVVCTALKPHLEMVEDGRTGLVYPVGEVDRLTEILRRLIADPELRQSLGAAGQAAAQRRRWRDTASATVRFYEALMRGSR